MSRGEPYDLYLRGQHALSRGDQQGIKEAIAYFRHSLELDPTFAPALEALAVALEALVDSDYLVADVRWKGTRKATEHPLRLNPHSARAHALLGEALLGHDWDRAGAERELGIAMSLGPNDSVVLTHAAQHRLGL